MGIIKNKNTESKAVRIAQAIVDEDSGEYVVAHRDAEIEKMKRWELLAFRDRVRELTQELPPSSRIVIISSNQS